ncbi:signal peptidase I [Mucilaginibacter limnophilus]|uniref:Signal peptidase I n=1 Tax=Mucilaginibacter limnophilus TaxID=1932778 RepID=A0A437MUM9_9SPHI|nr:signal peptidase I [Mucilaginibacter limnophilus]RVU01347.1 signal peptidase I [Mucilaginibacter limnophilus]
MNWKFLSRKKADAAPKKKKTKAREWLDAIVFAVVVSTVIRGLLFSAYAIPSASMEGTEMTGDYLFVSKLSYGARMPITPLSIPFFESHVTGADIKTYSSLIKLPYFRLPGLGDVEKGDIVVFNYPGGTPKDPVDMRVHYIKRCVAIPGDVMQIVDTKVIVNGKVLPNAPKAQTSWRVNIEPTGINPKLLEDLEVQVVGQVSQTEYIMIIPAAALNELKNTTGIKSITPVIEPKGEADPSVYPQSPLFKWNQDNYGPLTVPKKGWTISLNDTTAALYGRCITLFEGNTLKKAGADYYINNKKATSYTFKMGYYWMMGDNRHNSEDSRYWGFVPEDHVVGKPMFTFMSIDSTKTFFNKVRWNRVLRGIN